jgi:hypothetical protein
LENLRLLRRLLAVVLICAGLLAISNPAVACALEAAKDCFPAGAPPCGDMPPDSSGIPDMAMCCVAAPAPSSGAAFESVVRERMPVESPAPAPDFGLTLAWLLAQHPPETIPIVLSPETLPHCDDATLTYLYTQRLRL